jgi:hypothetical protein
MGGVEGCETKTTMIVIVVLATVPFLALALGIIHGYRAAKGD